MVAEGVGQGIHARHKLAVVYLLSWKKVMVPLAARRTFRFAAVVALSLACAYALGMQFAFLAPVLAVLFAGNPAPPVRLKGLMGLIVVVLVTMGAGLLLIPFLRNYTLTGVLIIAAGLYVSAVITVGRGKALIGALLTIGVALIPAIGLMDYGLAAAAVDALTAGVVIAVICQWIVYPLFPEDAGGSPAPTAVAAARDCSRSGPRAPLIGVP